MSEQIDLQADLPLREPTFFILLSLSTTPKHGYAIMKEIEVLSTGRVRLSTSTLYGALKRMLDQGWIVRFDESAATAADAHADGPEPPILPSDDSGRERKAYALTDLGRSVLGLEIDRLRALVSVATQRTAGALS